MRRFPHGGTNRPGHARPTGPYGRLVFRPGLPEPLDSLPVSPELARWADVTEHVVLCDVAGTEPVWVVDDHT